MSKRTVRILFCMVGHPPQVVTIDTEADHLERLVGAGQPVALDCVRIKPGVELWCIEDAIARGCAPNRNVPGVGWVHGPFFLAQANEEGDMLSLTDECLEHLTGLVETWPPLPASWGKKN